MVGAIFGSVSRNKDATLILQRGNITMKYRRLGRCGLKLGELSLGAGNWGYKAMDEKMIGETVALALDAGINYLDNAQSYTNGLAEEIMGRLFRKLNLRRVS